MLYFTSEEQALLKAHRSKLSHDEPAKKQGGLFGMFGGQKKK